MKKPENREIDKIEYQVFHMGPKQQIKTMKFVMNTVGKPLGALSKDDSGKGLLDANAKVIGLFIESAIDSIDEDKIIDQIEILLKSAHRKNEKGGYAPVTMEVDFHGELMHLLNVIRAVLEVNFGSFLGVSTDLVNKLKGSMLVNKAPSSEAQL